MRLNAYVAEHRRRIFEDLLAGRVPSEGAYDEAVLRDARAKGKPQMGSVRLRPDAIELEFIYAEARSATTVLTVRLDPPERIVFLPVPAWVVESIWQGDISGSHEFESDARKLLLAFESQLTPEANAPLFDRQEPKRRE